MNQRAASAPYVAIMWAPETTFFFDFDIFSMGPTSNVSISV